MSYPGVAGIFDGPAQVDIGGGGASTINGKVHYAEIRNGINGTVVNKFDPNDATATQASAGSWAASSGETWTVNRSGTNLPADIQSDLTTSGITGLPSGGTAIYRFIDGTATYNFTPTSIPLGTPCAVSIGGFINTGTPGNYSSTITTYNNAGPPPTAVDSVTTSTVNFSANTTDVTVSIGVDPSLTFSVVGRGSVCNSQSATNFQAATSTLVPLGHLNAANTAGAAQDLSVSTNAGSGFVVYARTDRPTPNSLRDSSSHSITDVNGTNASPGAGPIAGTEGFGYTSNDASTSFTSNTWAKLTNTNDSVMIATSGIATKSSCIGFQVAVGSTTEAGSYSTNVLYTVVPAF